MKIMNEWKKFLSLRVQRKKKEKDKSFTKSFSVSVIFIINYCYFLLKPLTTSPPASSYLNLYYLWEEDKKKKREDFNFNMRSYSATFLTSPK